ncbi:hypothetical protein ILUMI_04333 [Ignelater luminosus]|uniref:Uncharacterized protein n=1 Tax=Ignelater luminosus TaxID=2038154 RepID=A0A8K0GLA4_IGNLU|nr:hypothetical protein ILUMI_04333 [Ignelater luminosus]
MNIVMGGFNSKIQDGKVEDTIGPYGLGVRNGRGGRLHLFVESYQLSVMNTVYKLPPRRLYKWKHLLDLPENIIKNQIDYVMKVKSKQKILNLLNDKRSSSENNVASNNRQELSAPKKHVLLTEQDVLKYNTQLERGIFNIQPVTTKTGKLRQRVKWTDEINRTVMYCYYKATNGEKELLGYRGKMYNLFVNIHPQMKNVTEQRIADQRRMIVVNNKIPQTILDELKVNATRQEYQSTTQDEHIITIDSNNYEKTTQNEHIIIVDRSNKEQNHEKTRFEVESEVEKETEKAFMIRQELEKNLIKYYGADPTKRERLLKLRFNKKTPLIIHEINRIIQNKIDKDMNIEEINSLIYCGAISTIHLHSQTPYVLNSKPIRNQINKPPWQKRIERKIEYLRNDIERLMAFKKSNSSKKLERKVRAILSNCYRLYSRPEKAIIKSTSQKN